MTNQKIDELFYSHLNPWYDRGANGVEKNATYNMTQCKKALLATMTDEQKAIFEKYEDACLELSDVREPEIFKTGFRFGMRLAFEGLTTDET